MKTIIAGVDFTHSSYNAARYAAMLAKQQNCKLLLLNLYDAPLLHSNSGLFFMATESLKESHQLKLNRCIERLKAEYPKLDIGSFVTTGSFRDKITSYVKDHQVQCVVLGLATKNRFSKFIYGSHSTDIAGRIDCPVIIVPEKFDEPRLRKVLLAADNANKILKTSLKPLERFLKSQTCSLEVLHIRTENELIVPKKRPGIKINNKNHPVVVINGDRVEKEIAKYAQKRRVDLVAVLSKRHSALYNFFNETNTKNIAFATQIPVIAFHE